MSAEELLMLVRAQLNLFDQRKQNGIPVTPDDLVRLGEFIIKHSGQGNA